MNGYQEPAVLQPQDEHSFDDGEASDGFDLYVSYDSCLEKFLVTLRMTCL